MVKHILQDRINFYLDSDKECRWKYVGLISESSEFFPSGKPSDLRVALGACSVCGKNPIVNNYILKYEGKEKPYVYASVGSECIEYLGEEEYLKIKADQKKLKEMRDGENAKVFGKFLSDFLADHKELWNMKWSYFGKEKNLGGSVKFLSEKCMEGKPMHEKTFGKEVKKALKDAGLELPDLRDMKKYLAEVDTMDKHPGNAEKQEIKMVPDGYEFVDYYGISPITGKRDIVYVTLKNLRTGEEEFSDVIPEWNPVIEVVNAVEYNQQTESHDPIDVMHVHLQKFIQSHRKITKKESVSDPVLMALKLLAGKDTDFASEKNNIGFNGRDTEFGHSLASNDHLSEKQREWGKRILRKYHRQIPKELWEQIYGDEQ